MSESDYKKSIIIDNGSGYTKIGFAGETSPRFVFPTITGFTKNQPISIEVEDYPKKYYTGNDAIDLEGVLELIYPMEKGIIEDFDAMEHIWHYIFHDKLKVDPSEHPVFLTEDSLNPSDKREKTAEILFEKFDIPAMYISSQDTLSMYASGKEYALIVDSGYTKTSIVPFGSEAHLYHNRTTETTVPFPCIHAIRKIGIGGRDMDEFLAKLLKQRGYYLPKSHEKYIHDIKEKLCFVAYEPDKYMKDERNFMRTQIDSTYLLPDEEAITLDIERFLVPEMFFNPSIIGLEEESLHEQIKSAIYHCEITLRQDLFNNIILCGGTALIPGLKERLYKELKKIVTENTEITIHTPAEREYYSWIGASKISSLREFSIDSADSSISVWVTKEEYLEKGSKAVMRCFK